MGRIFEAFGSRKYANEAEISQNFLLPLLTEYLGYDRSNDVVPEHLYPAFDIPQNRAKRLSTRELQAQPDYVLRIATGPVAALDSKGPDEDLDFHLDQLRAYCIAVGTNLLLITNGTELRLYDANDLLFVAHDIQELDLRFSTLEKLIGKAAVSSTPRLHERFLTIDPTDTGVRGPTYSIDDVRRRIDLAVSDFRPYLATVRDTAATATRIPESFSKALSGQPIRVSSRALLEVRVPGTIGPQPLLHVLALPKYNRVVLVGESGIGKTVLLHELLETQAQACLDGESSTIPVFLRLGEYAGHRSIEEHIQSAIAVGGVDVTLPVVRQLMGDGRLLFLFDAYDEAFAADMPGLSRALTGLVRDYERCQIVLSTRQTRRPQLALPVLSIERLSSERIQDLLRKQLGGAAATALLRELRRTHLMREASNTLLLTLMVLAFNRSGRLPRTRRLLLGMLLDAVRAREEEKPPRFGDPVLPWSIIEHFLVKLAYAGFLASSGYSLDQRSVDSVLRDSLELFEAEHRVSPGVLISSVMDQMAATGFVTPRPSGIVFWHRRIMEHFASFEIARRIDVGELDVSALAGSPEWQDVLPAAVARCSDSERVCSSIFTRNVFLAGACGVELPDLSRGMRDRIVSSLAGLCRSEIDLARDAAVATLNLINWNEATDALESLLETGPGNVQTEVLPELAARHPERALLIANRKFEWHPSVGAAIGASPESARVAALAESTEVVEAQEKIIEIWAATDRDDVSYSSAEALLSLSRRSPLSEATVDALLSWTLPGGQSHSSAWAAARVLRGIRSPAVAKRIIESLRGATGESAYTWELEGVLRETDDHGTKRAIFDAALDHSLAARTREPFARVLSDIPGLELGWYKALFADADLRIRSFALLGMKHSSFAEISDEVDQALRVSSGSPTGTIERDHAYLQACAVESLAAVRNLPLLLEPGRWPFRFFHLALARLAEGVSDHRLVEFVPALQGLLPRCHDSRAAVGLCYALADLGETSTAVAGITRFLEASSAESFVRHDIVSNLHRLPRQAAVDLLAKVWADTLTTGRDGYLRGLCIEAMERIGALDLLKEVISWTLANDTLGLDCERAIRALAGAGSEPDEHWLFDLIRQLETNGKGFSLRNAVWVAGNIGGARSLTAVDSLLAHPSTGVRNAAFWAANRIRARQGEVWYQGLERGTA